MKYITFLLVLLTCFSCGDDDSTNVLQIRISNVSEFNYSNIVLNTSGGEQNYEILDAGQTSSYNTFDFAYRFAYVELQIDDETFIFQPIDYIEEDLLRPGNYTYQISVSESNNQISELNVNLIQD